MKPTPLPASLLDLAERLEKLVGDDARALDALAGPVADRIEAHVIADARAIADVDTVLDLFTAPRVRWGAS